MSTNIDPVFAVRVYLRFGSVMTVAVGPLEGVTKLAVELGDAMSTHHMVVRLNDGAFAVRTEEISAVNVELT